MFFVIENYFNNRKAKIEAWYAARDKWIVDDNNYGYRDKRAWEQSHSYPVLRWSNVFSVLVPVVGVLLVVGTLATLIINHEPSKSNHATTQKKDDKKTVDIKVGDKVQVVYGDYKDSVGEVVKVGEKEAIIKLINSSYTHAMADAQNRTGGQDNGSLLSIGDLNNLVPYKETK